jgi:excisionase family DNA binding protein
LRYTSALTTTTSDPVAVVINASPLVGWLEDAADKADLEVRCMAMCRQHTNRVAVDPDDDPDRVLAEARTLYAFLTAGTVAVRASVPLRTVAGLAAQARQIAAEMDISQQYDLIERWRQNASAASAIAPPRPRTGPPHLAKGPSDPMNTTMADPAPQAEPRLAAEERLLTPGEVAALFRVDPKTVTRWAAAGRIASLRTPGGHRRFRESLVHALLTAEEAG